MTSAPRSPSNCVHHGPARTRDRSSTRTPASGAVNAAASTAADRRAPRARHYAPERRSLPARVCARPAQIKALERHPVVGRTDHRPGAEQLVEAHLAVENVAADQTEA